MDRSTSILKQGAFAHRPSEAGDLAPGLKQPLRIRSRAVRVEHLEHEEAPPFKLSGILKGQHARVPAAPYAVATVEFVPDFPLPDIEQAGAEEQEEARSRDELEAAWQARLEEAVERARAEAYKEGYEQGYVAAEAALQASFEQRTAMLEEDVARLQAAWKDFMKKSEPLLVSLAFEMVKQVLDTPLPQDVRAVSGKALAQALEQFGEDTPIEISLHPDDLSRLQAYGLTDDLQAMHSGIRWDPNPDISMGDWIAQSPDAAIRRLKDDMLNQLKSRLGLLAVMKSRDS